MPPSPNYLLFISVGVSRLFTYLLTHLLTPWCRVLLEKLTGLQLVKKFPHFMEPESSLPHSQTSATCLYPGPAQSSPYTHIPPPGDHPNIIHPSTPRSPQWSPSLRFPHQDPIQHPLLTPTRHMPQLISFFLILSPAQYWVRSTNHFASRYAVSFIPPLPRPS